VNGNAGSVETPIGHLPAEGELNLDGIAINDEAKAKLFGFDHAGWQAELASIGEYLEEYGPRMPQQLKDEQQRIARALAGVPLAG
jgi:phosphoenolpyruvate carboxykinase (GTP)